MNSIKGKVVFVTGAGSGIGRSTALKLLSAGAKVFGMSRTEAKLTELKEEAASGQLEVFSGDVRSEADVQAAFAACVEKFGAVESAVNEPASVAETASTPLPAPSCIPFDAAITMCEVACDTATFVSDLIEFKSAVANLSWNVTFPDSPMAYSPADNASYVPDE